MWAIPGTLFRIEVSRHCGLPAHEVVSALDFLHCIGIEHRDVRLRGRCVWLKI